MKEDNNENESKERKRIKGKEEKWMSGVGGRKRRTNLKEIKDCEGEKKLEN